MEVENKKPAGIGKARARQPQSVAAIRGSSESLESPWQDAQPKPEDLETPPNMKLTPTAKRSLSVDLRHAKTIELSPSAGEREEEYDEREKGDDPAMKPTPDDEHDTEIKPSGKHEVRDATWWRCNPQIYI